MDTLEEVSAWVEAHNQEGDGANNLRLALNAGYISGKSAMMARAWLEDFENCDRRRFEAEQLELARRSTVATEQAAAAAVDSGRQGEMPVQAPSIFSEWTRADWLVVAGLIIAAGAIVAGVMTPEIRRKLALERPDPTEAIDKFALGSIRFNGAFGVPVDKQRAVSLWKDSAELGYPLAQYQVGFVYETGQGGEMIDLKKALEWYQKAADRNEPTAEYRLGKFYEMGWGGLKPDIEKAIGWYLKVGTYPAVVPAAQMELRRLCALGYQHACAVSPRSSESRLPAFPPFVTASSASGG